MKNLFKVFGIALAACTIFAACNGDTYKITVKANDNSMGTVTGGGNYALDETATLEATPNQGYKFVEWVSNDVAVSTSNPYLVTVTADAEYIANFAVASGVNVKFGTTNWDAQYINAQMSLKAIMVAAGQVSATAYPIVKVQYTAEEALADGTYTGTPTITETEAAYGNPYCWYFEQGEWSQVEGTGDWWNRTMTMQISGLDAEALTANVIVNATMANVEALGTSSDLGAVDNRDLTVTVTNQQFSAAKANAITYNRVAKRIIK